MGESRDNSSIICYYIGTDPWGPVRWHRYFAAVSERVVRVWPDDAAAITSNAELLRAAMQKLSEYLTPQAKLEVSLCVVDLQYEDLDAEVFSRLSELVADVKSAIALDEQQSEAAARCPIVVLLPQTLVSSRNWIASIGADLVVERTRDLSEIVQSATGSMPRYAKSVHPWLAGLAVDA